MRRRLHGRIANDDGTAAIEFALVLPLMIALFMGIFEVTRVVGAEMRLTAATQSIADMMAQQANIALAESANFCNGAKMTLYPLPATSLKVAVASVTKGVASTTVDWNDIACGGATAISNAATLAPTLVPNVTDSVIIVQTSYSYTSPVSYVLSASYTLTATAYARPRNVATVTHD
jgi:Flp pilus assembly protein TadG